MDYSITQQQKRKIAGFHLVGPWEHTVKQGFEQLVMWVDGRHIEPLEWVAVYYDNPDEVPAEKLRCDTAVTVPDDFVIPENSEGVMMTEIAEGIMPWRRRVWKTTTLPRRGISSSIPCCRTISIRWRSNPASSAT
jgi:DNA gyrase inhibitor GyrI